MMPMLIQELNEKEVYNVCVGLPSRRQTFCSVNFCMLKDERRKKIKRLEMVNLLMNWLVTDIYKCCSFTVETSCYSRLKLLKIVLGNWKQAEIK